MTLRSLLGIAVLGVLTSVAVGNLAAGVSPEAPEELYLPAPETDPRFRPSDPLALRAWPDEELAGGATTVHDDTPTAYGRALANLERSRWEAMRAGKRLFEYPWRAPDEVAVTAPRRGLGPLHNATACADCHFRDGRGGPPSVASRSQPGERPLAPAPLLARLSLPSAGLFDAPDPIYGGQLNDRGTGAAPEGRLLVEDERVTLGDGTVLRRPLARVVDLSGGPLHPQTSLSLRIPPTLVGLGLLEAVPESQLEALADPEDRDGDGVSGRVRRLGGPGADGRVGRFGWKAGEATLEGQIARAFHEDLGVTSTLYREPNCPPGDEPCREAHGGVELDPDDLRRAVLYTRLLAPPARRDWQDPQVLAGRDAFLAVGCGACHRPRLETARAGAEGSGPEPLPELAGQVIRPYTDLLLHDMGPGLDDGVAELGAASSEWRTPPLWGLGLLERVNGHARFLHDGRARSFEEAILWHGGEAEGAREAYRRLPEEERLALLRFLRSL